jgi:hypothetical protein
MRIDIKTLLDVPKLLAFLRSRSPSEFRIPRELVDEVLLQVKDFAKRHRIKCEIVAPQEHRVHAFAAGGILLGAMAGFSKGGAVGAAAGAALGAVAGYYCAHLVVHITPREDGDFTLTVQPK